jgi:hypothetical protein
MSTQIRNPLVSISCPRNSLTAREDLCGSQCTTHESFPTAERLFYRFPLGANSQQTGLKVLSVFGDPKYWLFHVWDFVRVSVSKD